MLRISANVVDVFTKAVSWLADEVRIDSDDKGVQSRIIDNAYVCMASIGILKDAFDDYEAIGSVGVDLRQVTNIVKNAKKNEPIVIEKLDGKIVFYQSKLRYTLSEVRLDTIRKLKKLLSLDLPVSVTMERSDFTEAVNAACSVSDDVIFHVADDKLKISSASVFTEVEYEMDKEDGLELTVEGEKKKKMEVKSKFDAGYLVNIVKGLRDAGPVTINLGNDMPISVRSKYYFGEIEYLLAPRVEGY